jgi:hypothetical protein
VPEDRPGAVGPGQLLDIARLEGQTHRRDGIVEVVQLRGSDDGRGHRRPDGRRHAEPSRDARTTAADRTLRGGATADRTPPYVRSGGGTTPVRTGRGVSHRVVGRQGVRDRPRDRRGQPTKGTPCRSTVSPNA